MKSICVIRDEASAKPTGPIKKERDDFFHSFSVYGAATAAQLAQAALVGRHLTGSADLVAAAVWPTVQTGRRVARLQRQLIHQFCHSGRGHYVGAVRRRLERHGSDHGYESRGDGPAAGLADSSRGDHYGPNPFNVSRERRSITDLDCV